MSQPSTPEEFAYRLHQLAGDEAQERKLLENLATLHPIKLAVLTTFILQDTPFEVLPAEGQAIVKSCLGVMMCKAQNFDLVLQGKPEERN